MEQKILFNHIPKTGGTTLRIIFNKVYGQRKVFFIKSTDPTESLNIFKKMTAEERIRFNVISGHGAEYFTEYLTKPFRISILRNPIELFLSQYYYLKLSPNSVFMNEVSRLNSIESYIAFALKNGQDNLMTRYLSNSIDWLFNPGLAIPNLQTDGKRQLERAKENLRKYDAVLNLTNFDSGVFKLKELLGWKRIPLYRPANKTKYDSGFTISPSLRIKLEELLSFDMELFQFFIDQKLEITTKLENQKLPFRCFQFRQGIINKIF